MNKKSEHTHISKKAYQENKKEIFQLIERAKSGSKDAFDSLAEKYAPLIESRVTAHALPNMSKQDIEDMRQEALIIFYNAVCNFDLESDGVEFGLYAKICVENGLISFVRSYIRHSQKSVYALDEDASNYREDSVSNDPMQDLIDSENYLSLVKLIDNNLSEYESRVWWLYVSGISVSDIAKKLGISDPKSVTNAIYRIRKKLRARLSEQ